MQSVAAGPVRAASVDISTQIVPAGEFYFAEEYHQQYLSDNKNPYGYCPDHGTVVSRPVGVVKASD